MRQGDALTKSGIMKIIRKKLVKYLEIAMGISLRQNKIIGSSAYGKYYPEVDTQNTLGPASYFVPTILVCGCSRLRRLTTVTTACARLMKARPVAVSLLRAAGVPASPLSQMLCTSGI